MSVSPLLDSLHPGVRKAVIQFMVLYDAEQVLRELGPPQAETVARYLDQVGRAVCRRAGFPPDLFQAMIDNRPPIDYGEQP